MRSPTVQPLVPIKIRLLAATGIAIAYIPLLMRSFWVDEAGTFWMARGGPIAAVEKTWHWPGQSILYSLISSFFVFDRWLRVPAIIGGLLLCYFLYRLAEDAIGKESGWIAAILCAFHPLTIEFATQARPYSLAMAAVTASFWNLQRWVETRSNKWLIWWSVSTVLLVWLHYLFLVALAGQVVYLVCKHRHVQGRRLMIAAGGAVVACLPLAPHLALLLRESGTLPFMASPGPLELARLLLPGLLLVGLSIAFFIITRTHSSALRVDRASFRVVLVWWLAGPLLLFAVSNMSPMKMFVPRYLAYSGPAAVLLLTAIGFRFFGAQKGLVWAVAGGLLSTGSPLNLLTADKPGLEELGPFMRAIRQEGPTVPVLFASELPESNSYDWKWGNAPGSYLYAPFVAYPMPNRLIPLPKAVSDDAKAYLEKIIPENLGREDRVLLIMRDRAWLPIVAEEFQRKGFGYNVQQPNSFYVVQFARKLAPESSSGHTHQPEFRR